MCCSQGQNSKDEAKARTVKAEAKAWTLEAKAKTKNTNLCPRGSSRPRPVLEDYITDSVILLLRIVFLYIIHTACKIFYLLVSWSVDSVSWSK